MRIVWVTENEISPMQGGTERITATLATAFMARGHECVSLCFRPCAFREKTAFSVKYLFDVERHIGRAAFVHKRGGAMEVLENQLSSAVADADVVVCNLVDIRYKRLLLPMLYSLTRASGARLFSCYHAMPGEELIGTPLRNCLWHIRRRERVPHYLREAALTLTPRSVLLALRGKYIRSRYTLMRDNSDEVVLLSERFIPLFAALSGNADVHGLAAMPNALSFDTFMEQGELADKCKEILIVSRLDEKAKRLSSALEIWSRVKHDGWRLVIVGGGPDEEYYRRMALRLHLRDVAFEGRQPDLTPYYRRASIFMMTSAFEGWGITLTEAQQYGAVPIAYESYASLRDIIDDGVNGVVVPYRKRRLYVKGLRRLMRDDKARHRMSLAAVDSSRRFAVEEVVSRWERLFISSNAEE